MAALTIEFPQTVWTVEFGGDEIVVAEVTMTGGTGGGFDGVHNDLDGRSTADAHPISAITGLTAALEAGGASALADLTDVDVETDPPAPDDVLAWDGTNWTPATLDGGSGLELGETSSTAHRGDHGKTAHDHSQVVTGNPHGTAIGDISGLQTAIDAKAPLASPTFTGTPVAPTAAQGTNTTQVATTAMVQSEVALLAPKTRTVGTGLSTSGTVNLDMAALHGTIQTIALSGNPTFTTSNRAAGREVTLIIAAGGSSRTLAWPSWIAVGAALPTALASGKTLVATVTFVDTTDAAAVAAAAVQP